jgi:hypothetical protein
MANYTYKIALRDNIDNQYVTGSTIYPYYPPTAAALSASIVDNTYTISAADTDFTGYEISGVAAQSYLLPDGQIVSIRRGSTFNFYIELTVPEGYVSSVRYSATNEPVLKGPTVFKSYDTMEPPSEQEIVDYINQLEDRRDSYPNWRKFTTNDLQPIDGIKPPPTYGFRIKTPGYTDLQLFAQTDQGILIQAVEGVVDLGIKKLTRVQTNQQKEVASFQQVDSKAINKNSPNSENAKGLDKLSQILQGKASTLQSILVGAIVAEVAKFGISNIKQIVEDKVPIDKLPRLCPTKPTIERLIIIRNRLTGQLNTFYTNVRRLSTGLTGTEDVAQAISIGITVVSTTRKLANVVLSFIPVTPGAAPSGINILKDIEDEIKPRLDKILKTVGVLTSTIAFIAAILATIIQLLSILDQLILLCAQEQGIPFEDINALLTQLDTELVSNLQNSTSTVDNTYKGFKFEILLDVSNDTKYPKRYVVAKDKFGVILLKGESSFTPNPQVLIDELKFVIDRDNLSAE